MLEKFRWFKSVCVVGCLLMLSCSTNVPPPETAFSGEFKHLEPFPAYSAKNLDEVVKLVESKLESKDKPFTLMVRLAVKSESLESFTNAAREHAQETLKEPDCVYFGYHREIENPTQFVLFETWRDFNAFKLHESAPHTLEYARKIQDADAGTRRQYILLPIQ